MTYETYRNGEQFREFGIYLLTGEACGVNMRVLCDVSAEGKQILESFLRVRLNAEPWNYKTDGHEHVASIMLPYGILEELWVFCHLHRGTKNVFRGGYVSFDQWTETESLNETYRHPVKEWKSQVWAVDEDNMLKVYGEIERGTFYIERSWSLSNQPGTGLDNQHAISGRTT